MKLLLDTSLPKILLVLFENNKILFKFNTKEQKKADLLPIIFQQMLKKNNIKTSNIKCFYVTKGPGSFMGSRVGLTFIRTICQITGAKLFLADTLHFISVKSNQKVFLDAKSHQSYMFDPEKKETKLVDFHKDTYIDYEHIINNLDDYLKVFKEIDPDKAKPLYLKNPRIGG